MDKFLADYLASLGGCEQLSLNNKFFGDKGCAAIAAFLEQHKNKFTTIELQANNITSSGVDSIAKALASQSALRSLSLEWNPVRDSSGLRHLCQVVAAHPSIKTLSLRECQVGPCGASAIAEMIKGNRTLESVDVAHNEFGLEGGLTILNVLQDNGVITQLNLTGNAVGYETLSAVEACLRRNKGLPCSPRRRGCALQPCEAIRQDNLCRNVQKSLQCQLEEMECKLFATRRDLEDRKAALAAEAKRAEARDTQEKEVDTLRAELSVATQQLEEAQKKAAEKAAEANELRGQLEHAAASSDRWQQMTTEHDTLKRRFEELQRAHAELQDKHKALHQEKCRQQERADRSERELLTQTDQLTKDRQDSELRCSDALRQLHFAEEDGKRLKDEMQMRVDEADKGKRKMREAYDQAQRRVDTLEGEIRSLESELRHAKDEKERRDEVASEMQSKYEKRLRERADKETELCQRLAALQKANNDLQLDLATAEEKAKSAESTLAQREEVYNTHQQQVDRLKTEMQSLGLECAKLREEVRQKERQVKDAQNLAEARELEMRHRAEKALSGVKTACEAARQSEEERCRIVNECINMIGLGSGSAAYRLPPT
ncbi:unnamed protein product [Vitrella brassicaformis CCMP3155]|uniref:Uncharacterized protein n=1 Tax=Vitrella brassicaformis (strain CCMP3155) TaxID=1169540 RepID=A0A0G4FQF1_VITBC|nr:unnamed protein product [Vitrella brassicaformis CCMP3155]|eukprot:CEM16664.1 unnamed protein product [Vitrella brassicaformis CCMP3155]